MKSLQGEQLVEAAVGKLGLQGDRSYGMFDPATGLVLTARRDTAAHGRRLPPGRRQRRWSSPMAGPPPATTT